MSVALRGREGLSDPRRTENLEERGLFHGRNSGSFLLERREILTERDSPDNIAMANCKVPSPEIEQLIISTSGQLNKTNRRPAVTYPRIYPLFDLIVGGKTKKKKIIFVKYLGNMVRQFCEFQQRPATLSRDNVFVSRSRRRLIV